MAGKRRAKQCAEQQRRRDEEEQRQHVMVFTEFDAGDPEATMHAMAAEILRYRLCVRQLADAIELTRAGPLICSTPRRARDTMNKSLSFVCAR
jgi:hypothetical protein